jgi:hypothetical protein
MGSIGIRFLGEGTRGVEQREGVYAGHGGRLIDMRLCVLLLSGELTQLGRSQMSAVEKWGRGGGDLGDRMQGLFLLHEG